MTPNSFDLNDAFPSKYLKSGDIGNGSKIVTITNIAWDQIGPQRDDKMVLSFRETDKLLVLNKTNANTLAALFGNPLTKCVGQRVALIVMDVSFQGKMTPAIRISTKRVGLAAPAQPAKADDSNETVWVDVPPEDEGEPQRPF